MTTKAENFQGLVAKLSATPSTLAQHVTGISDEGMRVRNSTEEFSALENICHLRDIEIEGYEVRIVRILEESNPSLPDIDGVRLAIERDYNNQDSQSALKDFADARHRNIQRLKNLSPEQLELTGTLEGVGIVTLARLVEMMREHDEDHIRDLNIIQRRHRGASAT